MPLQKKSSQEHRRVGRPLDRLPIGERLTGKRKLLEHVDPGQNLAQIVIGLMPRLLQVGESRRDRPGGAAGPMRLAARLTGPLPLPAREMAGLLQEVFGQPHFAVLGTPELDVGPRLDPGREQLRLHREREPVEPVELVLRGGYVVIAVACAFRVRRDNLSSCLLHLRRDLGCQRALGRFQIVLALNSQPEGRPGPEVPAQAQRGFG